MSESTLFIVQDPPGIDTRGRSCCVPLRAAWLGPVDLFGESEQ